MDSAFGSPGHPSRQLPKHWRMLASGLMDAEWVFCEKFAGRYFVSFGFHAYAVLLWEVEAFGENQQYF